MPRLVFGLLFFFHFCFFGFDQKLTALKKAYADIILNTAKEAAARIMVSERKAMRFQQELASTKEEALRMLLRLKQMFDSKVCQSLSSKWVFFEEKKNLFFGLFCPFSLCFCWSWRVFDLEFITLLMLCDTGFVCVLSYSFKYLLRFPFQYVGLDFWLVACTILWR